MKKNIIVFITVAVAVAACSTSKRKTNGTPLPSPTAPAGSIAAAKPSNGIYEAGTEELAAIQRRFPDVTAEQLKQGHFIYSKGACVQCHKAMNIYQRDESQWKTVLDDMAKRARMWDAQKDAVWMYILAVKAVRENRGQ